MAATYLFHGARIALAVGAALVVLWLPGAIALMVWIKGPPKDFPAVWLGGALLIAAAFGTLGTALALIGWASQ